MNKKSVVIASGGLDSTVALAYALDAGHTVSLLHVNYGQRTEARELMAFHAIANHYGITEKLVVDITYLKEMEAKKVLLSAEVDFYLSEGKSISEIAEIKVNQRNMDRINSYIERGDYINLENLYQRNLIEYGQKEGPTAMQLLEKYGSYEEVIYSSVDKVNKSMNILLGLFFLV